MLWSTQRRRILFFMQTKEEPDPAGEDAPMVLAASQVFIASISEAERAERHPPEGLERSKNSMKQSELAHGLLKKKKTYSQRCGYQTSVVTEVTS